VCNILKIGFLFYLIFNCVAKLLINFARSILSQIHRFHRHRFPCLADGLILHTITLGSLFRTTSDAMFTTIRVIVLPRRPLPGDPSSASTLSARSIFCVVDPIRTIHLLRRRPYLRDPSSASTLSARLIFCIIDPFRTIHRLRDPFRAILRR
jgi:hypothetical protein